MDTPRTDDLLGPPTSGGDSPFQTVFPFLEMGAYEAIWAEDRGTTFKRLAERFAAHPDYLPSAFVPVGKAREYAHSALDRLGSAGRFGVRLYGAAEYPEKLRDANHPVQLLYYAGNWDLAWSPSVAVVGTRAPSAAGLARTRKLVESLVEDDFTVVSGLAAGIDTEAHRAAIDAGGRTIAVIGTPLSVAYPKANAALQREIADRFLVISQVPAMRYGMQDYRRNRTFFPERNVTMSALTEATVIVEAGATSGTLVQAKAALRQRRKLFILDSCFRQNLAWPAKLAEQGAIRVQDYDDIRRTLSATPDSD